jgi:membrane-associated phospholipid phosphatase
MELMLPNKSLKARTDTTPYNGHTSLYIAGFVGGLAILIITAIMASSGKATGWEYTWFMAVNGWGDGLYRVMVIITFFGSMLGAAAAVAAAFFLRFYRLAWRLALTIFGAYGVAYFAKEFIDRHRPEQLFTGEHVRILETGMGFPSGHATAITVIALSILPYVPWKLRWILPIIIAAVALSRLYLGVHVPLDVVGGVALGTAAVSFVRILPQSLRVWLRID